VATSGPTVNEDGDDPDRQSCCYRPTLADSGRCVWHTDPEDTGGKSPDAMRAARLDPDEEPGRTSEGGSFVELLAGADLSGANLSAADLSGARLDRATFADATLLELGCTDGHLIGTDLSGPSVERARLNRAELLGADLVGARLYGALLGDARIDRGTRLWPDGGVSWRRLVGRDGSDAGSLRHRLGTVLRRGRRPYCAYDPRYARDDGEPDVGRAAEVYGRLESLARDNSLPRLASECSLGRKDVQFMQCRRHGDLLMTLWSLVPNLVARYGETRCGSGIGCGHRPGLRARLPGVRARRTGRRGGRTGDAVREPLLQRTHVHHPRVRRFQPDRAGRSAAGRRGDVGGCGTARHPGVRVRPTDDQVNRARSDGDGASRKVVAGTPHTVLCNDLPASARPGSAIIADYARPSQRTPPDRPAARRGGLERR
jgi:hypothetical protein